MEWKSTGVDFIRAVLKVSWVSGRGHVGVEGVRERLTVEQGLNRGRGVHQVAELGDWGERRQYQNKSG